MSNYQLAQLNIATMLYPLDDPQMHGFTSQLDSINALADEADGFIWRLQSEEGDATSIRVFDDDMLIINMSVWKDIESLYQYVYYSDHVKAYKDGASWFRKMHKHYMAMWWIPVGHIPTTDEAKEKLELLEAKGPTAEAFTFKQRFEAPNT